MKKTLLFILCLSLLSTVFSSCEEKNDSDIPQIWSEEIFFDFESFEKYVLDTDNQSEYSKIDKEAFINLSPIIPSEELSQIVVYNNFYDVIYKTPTVHTCLMVQIAYGEKFEAEDNISYTETETPIESTDITEEGTYVFNINGTLVYYDVDERGIDNIKFKLGKHKFYIFTEYALNGKSTPEAQKAFVEAFMTEAGTAEMLERIKALIP